MAQPSTESLHESAIGIDQQPLQDIAAVLADGQVTAASAVRGALPEISEGAATLAQTLQQGGTLHYLAAGSSGLMAAADAQELGGTFSIPASQLRIHMAGGLPTGVEMPGSTEDEAADLSDRLAEISSRDTMIAVSASGSTPFAVKGAQIAKAAGASVIAIANNADTPLLELATCPILLRTPPEVLSGSTRMGAGTAQKIALNMLSTLMAVKLGHVYDGMMVNVRADNIKLRQRASDMVQRIADVPETTAKSALRAADGHVKTAVLIAAHNVPQATAQEWLDEADGHLRNALQRHQ